MQTQPPAAQIEVSPPTPMPVTIVGPQTPVPMEITAISLSFGNWIELILMAMMASFCVSIFLGLLAAIFVFVLRIANAR